MHYTYIVSKCTYAIYRAVPRFLFGTLRGDSRFKKLGTTSELPLIGITNFWNYHSLMLVIAMFVIPRFLIRNSTS